MADEHDDKGYSEEKCVRCGWVMGMAPLNCQNDNTPHRFPSQLREHRQLEFLLALADGGEIKVNGKPWREMFEATQRLARQRRRGRVSPST